MRRSLACALVALALAGCDHPSYRVRRDSVAQLMALPEAERDHAALAAERGNGDVVFVRARDVRLDLTASTGDARFVHAEGQAWHPLTKTGWALLGAGLVVSVLAGALWGVAKADYDRCRSSSSFCFDLSDVIFGPTLGVALSHVLVGGVIAVVGSSRNPDEVAPGRADVRYLDAQR